MSCIFNVGNFHTMIPFYMVKELKKENAFEERMNCNE